MAKLCSPYGTSPISSFFNELTPNSFSDELHEIQPDPFDIFEDLPSICGDIQKIESDTFSPYGGGLDLDLDMKPAVRNTDLMWWTAPPTTILSTSASSTSSDIGAGVSLAAVMGASTTSQMAALQIKVEKEDLNTPVVVTAKKVNPIKFKDASLQIKEEPIDDVEQQLAHHSIPNNKTAPTRQTQVILQSIGGAKTNANMQNIPPGTSLLRKSQQQPQKKTQLLVRRSDLLLPSANVVTATTTEACADLNSSTSTIFNTSISNSQNTSLLYQRPDTPHSLDDDCSTPEFRHNVDLRACVMGSNNISLTTDQDFIKNVTQELQDTSKKQIDTRLISGGCSLADVLDVINSSPTSEEFLNPKNTMSALTPSTTCSSGFSYRSLNTSDSVRSSESDSDEESTMGSSSCSLMDHDITYNTGGVSPVSSQTSNSGNTQHYMQHRDHSYTRCKDGIDDLSTNLETPSDSEEEIDVVSINDKKLPTNPSDKDRRVLQTKVAHKFNAARIVKNSNGLRTIPPRRTSYEYPYTPVSSSPVKSVSSSRFPSPAVTPYQSQYTTKYVQQQQQQQQQQQKQMMTVVVTDSATGIPINILSSADKSRKRFMVNGVGVGGVTTSSNLTNSKDLSGSVTSVVSMPPSKKHRGKKTKLVTSVQLPNGLLNRHYSVDETADTIEKRNLHNDMERQRRIGLKNLFEALKKQIPSIKDKERAPKVNILREAAKSCEALTREDQQLNELKNKLKEELKRKQNIVTQLKAARQMD